MQPTLSPDRICRAFADVGYPGDDNLTDSSYGEEPAALLAEFSGKSDWRALSHSFLDQAPAGWGTALCFFSGEALWFYLPAYLIADLEGGLEIQDPAFILTNSVTPGADRRKIARVWGGGTMGERARESFDRYSPEQVQVVVDYLFWRLEVRGYDPTIEQGLENYWLARMGR